jgi:hypothetical protein
MRRVSAALVAITAAATLVVLFAAPAVAHRDQGTFKVTHKTVRAGDKVKGYGWGCPGRSSVRFDLDDHRFKDAKANGKGEFEADLTIPAKAHDGERGLSARCGSRFFKVIIIIFHNHRGTSFSVSPRRVAPGDSFRVKGRCRKPGSEVIVKVDGTALDPITADSKGRFRVEVDVSEDAEPGTKIKVIAKCNGRFLGAAHVKVKRKPYPPKHPGSVTTDRTAVPAGQAVTITGDDCDDVAPVAKLDGKPLALTLHRTAKGKGFTATARVPRETIPGRHHLSAGCDDGSTGTMELTVLDTPAIDSANRQAFGPKPAGNLAIWAGLLAGVALLVTSLRVGRRRRS